MLPTPRPRFPLSALLATGQTTSYGSGAGVDDGALQKGIAKAYTILTTGQYSGVTAIAINGKTDSHSNNCVVDNNTGLMWSRYVSASVGPASDGKLPWTTNGGGEGIFPYCAAANLALLAGYGDWRAPNLYEFFSILDTQAPDAYPNATAFPSFVGGAYWTSSTTPNATVNALSVSVFSAQVISAVKTIAYFTMLVRG